MYPTLPLARAKEDLAATLQVTSAIPAIYNIIKCKLPKSSHMTRCQRKKTAEIQCGNRLRKARQKSQGKKKPLTMFAEIPHDKQPKREAKNDRLKQKWPTLLMLPNRT